MLSEGGSIGGVAGGGFESNPPDPQRQWELLLHFAPLGRAQSSSIIFAECSN